MRILEPPTRGIRNPGHDGRPCARPQSWCGAPRVHGRSRGPDVRPHIVPGRGPVRNGHGHHPDRFGAEVLRRVNARRRVFLSSSTIGGRYVLRICVLSFRTHADRVRDAVTALREEARRLAGA